MKQPTKLISMFGIALILIGFFARGAMLLRTPEQLTNFPILDDSYYSQSYARAISQGQLFTVNGEHKSNAFHPFYPFLCAPFYSFFEENTWDALRGVVGLHLLLFLLSLGFAYAVLKRLLGTDDATRKSCSVLGAGLYAISSLIFNEDMNLMQTGLQLTMFWFVLHRALVIFQSQNPANGHYALLGFALTLFNMARLDGIFLCIGFLGVLFIQPKVWKLSPKRCALVTLPTLAVATCWAIFSYTHTGSLVPTGGAANLSFPTLSFLWHNFLRAGTVVLSYVLGLPNNVQSDFWPAALSEFPLRRGLLLLILTTAVLGIVFLFLRKNLTAQQEVKNFGLFTMPFVLGLGLLVGVYFIFYRANYFFSRYFITLVPLFFLFWIIVLTNLMESIFTKKGRSLGVPSLAMIVFIASQLIIFARYQTSLLHSYSGRSFMQMVDLVKEHVSEQESIGSFETGILGFYWPKTVNLDGKTNTEALHAKKEDRMMEYIVESRLDYIVDRWGFLRTTQQKGVLLAKHPKFLAAFQLIKKDKPYLWKRKSI